MPAMAIPRPPTTVGSLALPNPTKPQIRAMSPSSIASRLMPGSQLSSSATMPQTRAAMATPLLRRGAPGSGSAVRGGSCAGYDPDGGG